MYYIITAILCDSISSLFSVFITILHFVITNIGNIVQCQGEVLHFDFSSQNVINVQWSFALHISVL